MERQRAYTNILWKEYVEFEVLPIFRGGNLLKSVRFFHRVDAALMLNTHASESFKNWFDYPQMRNEEIKGIVLCSNFRSYSLSNIFMIAQQFLKCLYVIR